MQQMPTTPQAAQCAGIPAHGNRDKLNSVDFQWFIVRSLPHQEKKLAALLAEHRDELKNILEVYCPTHTTVNVSMKGRDVQAPLFAGYVFVLSTQRTVADFMSRYYPEGTILYDSRKRDGHKPGFLTVPDGQMRFFRDFNENYADKVVILEKPYTDYAFNPKTNEPNETVKVIDGPLAGREGYIARFRRDKRLVFNMKALDSDKYYAVSVPNVWDFHVVRLHNAVCDRQTIGTMKERAVDLLIGLLQACGYGDNTLPVLYGIVDTLALKPSLVSLCNTLYGQGHKELGKKIAMLGTSDAELLINLVRYERDNPGYVRANWQKLVIRPFLTPTPGVGFEDGRDEAELEHQSFTEIIRKVSITEQTYYPDRQEDRQAATEYYAHVGIMPVSGGGSIVFANWDTFLDEYFQTAGKANERLVGGTVRSTADGGNGVKEKLIESFRNFAPTLYKVLAGESSEVRALRGLDTGTGSINVLAVTANDGSAASTGKAVDTLLETCVGICKEINSSIHLAAWRRYLRTVWLHK